MTARARGVVRGVVVIAGVTVAARVVGSGRWLVFSKTVGAGCLADAYTTANQLPNVVFELVVGGALAGAVIPVLAGPVARADRAAQGRIVGALLTWSALALAPVALAAWLLADAYTGGMLDTGADCPPGTAATAARMLTIFVPQVFGYAVAVIATAVLQSHHRFAAGALAPLVSSAIVIVTYLVFAGRAPSADRASRADTDLLAWGTTVGVLALALTVLVPMLALRLPVRPRLRLDPGLGPVVRRLAMAGVAALVAQQVAFLVVTYLANHRGVDGSVAVYTWAYAIFLLPFAVLAQPVTTAAFPRLSASYDTRDHSGHDRLVAASTRAVLLAAGAGAAVLAGTAIPVARVFGYDDGQVQQAAADALADALLVLAPGVVGFAVLMHAGRVLYARQAGRPVGAVTAATWVLAALCAPVITLRWDGGSVVAGLAAGMSLAMLAGGVAILVLVRRLAGAAAIRGVPRTAAVSIGAAVVAGLVGRWVAAGASDGGWGSGVLFAGLSGLVVLVAYGVLVGLGARDDVRAVLRREGRAG